MGDVREELRKRGDLDEMGNRKGRAEGMESEMKNRRDGADEE